MSAFRSSLTSLGVTLGALFEEEPAGEAGREEGGVAAIGTKAAGAATTTDGGFFSSLDFPGMIMLRLLVDESSSDARLRTDSEAAAPLSLVDIFVS